MKPLKRGDTYTPDTGTHSGHVIKVISDDAVRLNCLGEPLRSVLVRCQQDYASWTFQDAAREASDHWGDG